MPAARRVDACRACAPMAARHAARVPPRVAGALGLPRRILSFVARVQASGGMNRKVAAAHQRDIRRGLASTQETTYQKRIAEIAGRASSQKSACADELGQVKAREGANVVRLKLAAQAAALRLKVARKDGRAAVAQKAGDCRTEHAKILSERDEIKSDRQEVRTLDRQTAARARAMPKATAREKTSERRGERENEIPAELHALWKRLGSKMSGEQVGEYAEAHPDEAVAAQGRGAERGPSRREQTDEKEAICARARKDAQAAVARGEADPRQMNWLRKFCTPKASAAAPAPF